MPPQSSPTTNSPAQPTRTSSGSSGGLISPAGSPPLILAFLAIGIFSAAMIAVFGWRRVQYPREVGGFVRDGSDRRFGTRTAADGGGAGGGLASGRFGEKPILWEVWTDRNGQVNMVDYGAWDNIMPLAVAPVPHEQTHPGQTPSGGETTQDESRNDPRRTPPPSAPMPTRMLLQSLLGPMPLTSLPSRSRARQPESTTTTTTTTTPTSRTRQQRRRQRLDDFTPLALLRRHRPGGANGGNTDEPSQARDSTSHEGDGEKEREGRGEEDGEKVIGVAVVIEMPSPTSSAIRQSQKGGGSSLGSKEAVLEEIPVRDDVKEGEFQYCIGVHMCSWPSVTAEKSSSPALIPSADQGSGHPLSSLSSHIFL